MSTLDDINHNLDGMITRTGQSLDAMISAGSSYEHAVFSFVGTFLAIAERVENHAQSVTHAAVLLCRAVDYQRRISELEDQVAMRNAVIVTLEGLADF